MGLSSTQTDTHRHENDIIPLPLPNIFISYLWILIWVCRVLLVVKHFPQISQVKGFSPVRTLLKSSAGSQSLSVEVAQKWFTELFQPRLILPVWVLRCFFSWAVSKNLWWHWAHSGNDLPSIKSNKGDVIQPLGATASQLTCCWWSDVILTCVNSEVAF